MPRLAIFLFGAVLVLRPVAAEARPRVVALPPAATGVIDFARDVQPILTRACLSCHGPEKQRAGLRLDNRDAALRGGDSGSVLKPGDAAGSRLLTLVAGLDPDLRMPPAGKPALTTEEVGRLRAWIEQGVKWSAGTTGVKGPRRSRHWAFQPIRPPALPAVRRKEWVRNGVDAFVLARLEQEGIAPSPEADRTTLVRRLSLDLLGLPPSPEEVAAFLADSRPDAYERLVERLLASPHYGERWGRHWLDLARYADSDGYEKDTGRPFAWRYRHWVIAALNGDLPYDRYTLEQLAGDLLPCATTEQKVATGFHRNTLTNREGGVDREQFRVEQVVDRVNTTAKAFLGVTLGCAQCHDHKYDPFSHREYYQFFAFFNSDVEVDLPAPLDREKVSVKRGGGTRAQTLALGPGRKTHVLIRGDFLRKGVAVQPNTPAVLPPLRAASKPTRLDLVLARGPGQPADFPGGRELGLAQVFRPRPRGHAGGFRHARRAAQSPGIARLPGDGTGAPLVGPQGPAPLDRHLGNVSAILACPAGICGGRDPLNVLLARQVRQRLEAEAVRDVTLAASGLLTRKIGGPSVRPPQPAGISDLTYAGSARWAESRGPDRYRRGLYVWFQRTSPYPMLLTFDAPDSNVCAVRREHSNTPLQALTLLNDTVFVECARALGRRMDRAGEGTVAGRICYGFRLCVAREPTTVELTRLMQLFEELRALARANPKAAARLAGTAEADAAAWMALARTLLNLDEFVTRE